ncbi:hypothetical protein HNP92_000887 [Methanococcus maripaludis]|uniref:Uncharacterized protein n=1 Tax=Methanococcus maripaludis TaxID=39152 RepID=A0A7J9S489_METMI|nr:hypothetical protein [Methanococcus maripaludis]MBA2868925.1 hypothetical protein [Methanococcus maripaludis]MBB6401582.1 hypothetical protein [Methanococcus maripaludis]
MNIVFILTLVVVTLSFRKVCSNMANDFSGYENSQNNRFIDITQSFILILYGIFYVAFVVFLGKGLSTFEVFQSQSFEIKIISIFIFPIIPMYLVSVFASKQAVNYGLKRVLIKKRYVKKEI